MEEKEVLHNKGNQDVKLSPDDLELEQAAGGYDFQNPPPMDCPYCRQMGDFASANGNPPRLNFEGQFNGENQGAVYRCPKCGSEVWFAYHSDTGDWSLYDMNPSRRN
ncbi:MAG: hypothetical protein K5922_06130 [Clostridiales bacterium]|nr:hypothetical protein [Clostridiales bacterium]